MKERPLVVVNPRSGGGRAGRTFAEVRRGARAQPGLLRRGVHRPPLPTPSSWRERPSPAALAWWSPWVATARCTRWRTGCSTPASRTRPWGTLGRGREATSVARSGSSTGSTLTCEAIAERPGERVDAGRLNYRAHDGTNKHALVREHPVGGDGGPGRPVRVGDHQGPGRQGGVLLGEHTRARGVPAGPPAVRREPGGRHAARQVDTYMIAICNGRYFGSGMHVAPMAKPDDGRFEVVSMDAPGKLAFAAFSRRIYEGKHLSAPRCSTSGATASRSRSKTSGRGGCFCWMWMGSRWAACRRGRAGAGSAGAAGVSDGLLLQADGAASVRSRSMEGVRPSRLPRRGSGRACSPGWGCRVCGRGR